MAKHSLIFNSFAIRSIVAAFWAVLVISHQAFVGLQDGLKICLEDVLKTCHEASWRHILKMFLRHVLKTSSRRLGDKQNIYWGYLYLTNLNVYHFTNLYLTNLRQIQNALFRTQQFRYSSYFEIQAAFLF